MRRAVITGLGAVTPVGNDVPTTWDALVAGRSGIDRITRFDADAYPVNIAGEVKGFDPTEAMSGKEVRRTGRDVHLGVAAAMQAVADAGFAVGEPSRTGVIIGSCVGGMEYTLEQQRAHDERGIDRVSPHWIANMLPDTTTSHVATRIGARGVNYALVSACATGTHAVGDAAEVIRRGQADAILAGGTEAVVIPVVLAGFCAMRALVDGRDDPPGASRPFDATRAGFVLSEGAAVLLVEELEHARARGARIYCEVAGYGVSNDAFHVATPHPESTGVIEMIRSSLDRAGLAPDDVDYINAHGTSTPYNDVAETRAIKAVFGEHAGRLAISSTKSMVGHSFGAAGAIEAVATALTIHHGVIPPTINLRHPDPECDLDYVPTAARRAPVRTALSNSMGLGGHNGCIILRRLDED
jgi:3-oxoacyl-[acyl-carrier-protein] synthase II